jgi:hypothetical protein
MIYGQADYFLTPLLDGTFGVGQVFETSTNTANTVFCGISRQKIERDASVSIFKLSDVIAFVRCDDTALTSEQWPLAGFDQIPRFRSVFDFDKAATNDFPETPRHDPAVIEAFTNAVHGLCPWNSFGDLFDQIKRTDMDKPDTAT